MMKSKVIFVQDMRSALPLAFPDLGTGQSFTNGKKNLFRSLEMHILVVFHFTKMNHNISISFCLYWFCLPFYTLLLTFAVIHGNVLVP